MIGEYCIITILFILDKINSCMEKFNYKLSTVVSVYNEQDVLEKFYSVLKDVLEKNFYVYEIVFVNDGSWDNTKNILNNIALNDKNVTVIHFSRNFGHEAAMIAGIDMAKYDLIVCLDSDLQHPPEMIPQMVQQYINGFEIVMMKRLERKDSSLVGKFFSKLFYKLINSISDINFVEDASDFFLLGPKAVCQLRNNFRENNRFLRAFIQMMGFNRTFLEYISPARVAGKSKYNFKKLFALFINAIVAVSDKPLNIGILLGLIMGAFSVVVGIYSIVMYFIDRPISGYTTIVVLMSFMFSINLVVIGIIGKYIAYIFREVKKRPFYIIDSIIRKE